MFDTVERIAKEKEKIMKKKIGEVVLDYRFYPEKDLYSDGAVEDELLQIAKSCEPDEYNQVIADRKSWPVLYHFSHIRENIAEWIPLTKQDSVLEIGSGCGAVTGALALGAGKVTCIELSEKRSLINAYRHRTFNNIEILLGNFQDVEENLTEQYDYITLIGVYEYSAVYLRSGDPYGDMLKRIARHLKPNGKLLVAIENRLGLKYWAGCTEDHVGAYFEGLEDYPYTNGIRTFSRKELMELFMKNGLGELKFYYPYPDYKFPSDIFSDERLPQTGELRNEKYNFDRERVKLFNETRVWDTVIRNGLFPEFSNSFLVMAQKEKEPEDRETVIYARVSRERDPRFALRTEIVRKNDGTRAVRKYAVRPEGEAHLLQIARNYQKLRTLYENTVLEPNLCEQKDGYLEFEYVSGSTMEEQLDQLLGEKKYEEIWNRLETLFIQLKRERRQTVFRQTPEFLQVFGDVSVPEDAVCTEVTNIDPVCGNLVRRGERWVVLDYEWSFDFPVPLNYQIFRILKYYLYTSMARGVLHPLDFFGRAGLCAEEIEVYEQMEENFQRYIQGTLIPMRQMYQDISPGTILDLKDENTLKKFREDRQAQIFFDYGNDFSEKDSIMIKRTRKEIRCCQRLPEGIRRLRLDPCEHSCILQIHELTGLMRDKEEEPLQWYSNGSTRENGEILFTTGDPYIIMEGEFDRMEAVRLDISFAEYSLSRTRLLEELKQEREEGNQLRLENQERSVRLQEMKQLLAETQEQLRQSRELITAMENTKVWKGYQLLKKGLKQDGQKIKKH